MRVKWVKGDAIELAKLQGHCMIHCCNNKGVMGGGSTALATQVKKEFPSAFDNYTEKCSLGDVSADLDCNVINLVAQRGYGSRGKGIKYFKNWAFLICLSKMITPSAIRALKVIHGVDTIVVPEGIGSDRAGGDRDWILGKVEEYLSDHFNLIFVKWSK